MSFNDEDLKRLKELAGARIDADCVGYLVPELPALLARLECAEKVIRIMGSDPMSGEVGKAYEAWRKSKGEAGR